MSRPISELLAIKAVLRRRGNPYAFLEAFDEHEQEMLATEQSSRSAQRAYLRALQNPYATISDAAVAEQSGKTKTARGATHSSRPQVVRRSLSKVDFGKGCKRIFQQYIPAEDKQKLRVHHIDFISKNALRSPEIRYMMLQELQKYDLSASGITPLFNRERDTFTQEKLSKIERMFDAEKLE